jgi:hypothetical protein
MKVFEVFLKVHKIEIFFGFDFEICIISLLVTQNIKILPEKNFYWAQSKKLFYKTLIFMPN